MLQLLLLGFFLILQTPRLGEFYDIRGGITIALVLAMLMCAVTYFLRNKGVFVRTPKERRKGVGLLYFFLALQAIALLRNPSANSMATLGFLIVLLLLCWSLSDLGRPAAFAQDLPLWLFHAVGVLSVASAVLFLLHIGVAPPYKGVNSAALAWIGIDDMRQQMPLSWGLNFSGILGGASIIAAFAILSSGRSVFPVRLACFCAYGAAGALAVAYADTRSALLFAPMAILLGRAPRFSRYFGSGLPLLAVLVIPFALSLAPMLFPQLESLVGRDDTTLLSAREFIWASAATHLISVSPMHLIGYGYHGQETAGVTAAFSWIFADDAAHTTHNIVLQTIFDTGYLGAAMFLVVITAAAKRYFAGASPTRAFYWPFAMLLYLLATGATEAVPAVYAWDAFTIFFVLLYWMLAREQQEKTVPARAPMGATVTLPRAAH